MGIYSYVLGGRAFRAIAGPHSNDAHKSVPKPLLRRNNRMMKILLLSSVALFLSTQTMVVALDRDLFRLKSDSFDVNKEKQNRKANTKQARLLQSAFRKRLVKERR